MDRKQRKLFIIAATVIILCFAAISGATFALFTSNPNDGTVGINSTAGNLDVDIVDATAAQNSLVGEVLNFIDVSGNAVSGETEILFEPGAMYYTEGFRVVNKGNIKMNYIAYMSEDENFSNDFYDLFDVWITKNPLDRSSMEKIYKFEGTLEPEHTSDVYYLVFRMKETVGNEYQDQTFVGVGITVCAVQGNVTFD